MFLIFAATFLLFGRLAHAYVPILSDILEAPIRIAVALIVLAFTLALGLLQMIMAIFLLIAATFLQWLITAPIKLTSGGIVQIGWDFCRDIANMFFIVCLLVIAYATIFKKETYAMKSLLPTLVIIALLINFSQVVCGIIIDMSNILMNFFVKYGVADVGNILVKQNPFITDVLGIGSDSFWGPLSQVFGKPFQEVIQWMIVTMIKALVALLFTIVELLIIVAYGLILTIRIVIIWILVILAPIAWVARILPLTRGTWSSWWKNFIQWAVIGIIMLFFLYLAGYLLQHVEVFESCKMTPAESDDANINAGSKIIADVLCTILPSIMAIVLLLLGLFLGFSSGAGAPGFAQKIMRAPVSFVGGKAWESTKTGAASTGARMLGQYTFDKETGKWAYAPTKLGKFVGGMEKFPGVRGMMGGFGATRTKLEQAAMASSEKLLATKRTEDLKTEFDTLSDSPIKSATERLRMVGIANMLGKRNKFGEYINSISDPQKQEQVIKLIGHSGGDLDALLKYLPRFGYLIGKTAGQMISKMGGKEYEENMTPEDIKKFFNVSEQGHIKSVLDFGPPEKIKAVSESVNDFISSISSPTLKTELGGAGQWADRLDRMTVNQAKNKKSNLRQELLAYLSNRANVPSGVTDINDYAEKIIGGVSNRRAL